MAVIQGTIINRKTGKEQQYQMRALTEEDVEEMLLLQQRVLSNGGFDLLWFYPFRKEELLEVLGTPGNLVLGIESGGRLVAFRVGCCCGREYNEITGALGEDYRSRPGMLMNGVFVDEDYRGNKLQQKMSEYTVEQCQRRGIETFLTAIHPDNIASIRSLENIGFKRKKRTMLYQGRYDRVILVKERRNDCE